MGKTLIITEKPSVAQDIARALGGFKKKKGYYESDHYLMSWAVGHLFELAVPKELKEQDKWSLDKLPIMPSRFDLQVRDKSGARVKVLKSLLKSPEVSEVINACDAGREGELIFRYILDYAKVHKPVRRLWLQSMTPEAIRDGFQRLRTDTEMQPLAQAARSRNEADWLVGINATRAFTLRLSGGRGSTITTLGRVQTPTLAMIVDREKRIQQFKATPFGEVFATFQAASGQYIGRWFDEAFTKEESEPSRMARLGQRLGVSPAPMDAATVWDEHRLAARLWQAELSTALQQLCAGKPGVVELEEKKPSTQVAPQLYDLTTLQRDANNRFGFSAKRTLQIAQTLYEKHKVITYPRTDSRCLPEDYIEVVKSRLAALGPLAQKALDNGWVRPNKRVFNNAKVGDHFAIIPTGNAPHGLDREEQTVFDLIVKRFIAAFYPAAQYENTTRITRVAGEPFQTEGKILLVPGWLEVYGREAEENGDKHLPPVSQGEPVQTLQVEVKEGKTKPPPRFTEATILSAMENAGKLVEDEELAEAMKERGLGTPATRATIIEALIAARYLVRHGKELQPTPKAIQTIGLLKNAAPELTSPEMTGEWEYRLREIEHGKFTPEQFMSDIRSLTAHIVHEAKTFRLDEQVENSEPFGQCPKCGSPLIERFKSFCCTNKKCDFAIWKTIAGRLLSRGECEELLRKKQIGPLDGFRSKTGKRFSAIVKLNSEWKIEFDFSANDTGLKCEKCGKPLRIRSGRRGEFLACSGYPKCRNAMSFERRDDGTIVPIRRAENQDAPSMPAVDMVCEKCGQPMIIKTSRRGPFLACSGYPKCKNAKPLPEELNAKLPTTKPDSPSRMTDEKCKKCGAPMTIRKGRLGEFLGCSAYPKCKNVKKISHPTS